MIKYQSNNKGFTLLELLAVMGIMIIMATIAVTSYRSMVSGSGITASLGHLRQTLALARQQAIMQGKNAYVVFYQDTNESWYVTCLAQGTKTDRNGDGSFLLDRYRSDLEQITQGALLYNLSADTGTFAVVKGTAFNSDLGAWEIFTRESIWSSGCTYGWEVSKRIPLPRGFQFVDENLKTLKTPSTIRFKANGTAVNAAGVTVGGGQFVAICEEIRTDQVYGVRVNLDGSINVEY